MEISEIQFANIIDHVVGKLVKNNLLKKNDEKWVTKVLPRIVETTLDCVGVTIVEDE